MLWAFCLHVCLYTTCEPGALQGPKRSWILVSCRMSAEKQTQAPGRTAYALNCWLISSAPLFCLNLLGTLLTILQLTNLRESETNSYSYLVGSRLSLLRFWVRQWCVEIILFCFVGVYRIKNQETCPDLKAGHPVWGFGVHTVWGPLVFDRSSVLYDELHSIYSRREV